MFYIGGAGKKNAVREIMKKGRKEPEPEPEPEEADEETEDEAERSRSRSRSRISHASGDIVDDDSSNDSETESENDSENADDAAAAPPDNNDYITTMGSINTVGHHHHYTFAEEELDYDIEEFADAALPVLKEYQLVIYRINTRNTTPFLEFLFYHDKSQCRLPEVHHKPKHNIRKESDGIMDKLFTSKYRFKGYFHDELTDKCFVFYEKYFNAASDADVTQISLQKSHNWFWVCTTEIIHHRKYMTIPIDAAAVDFFIAYPTVGILQATLPHMGGGSRSRSRSRFQSVHIEAPSILYYGSTICYAKNTALYGLKREPIIARYGPFYYFTTLEHSYYWACYHNTAHNASVKRDTHNGGISRYAVFTKRMKTAFIDDDYDTEIVKKYTERKNMFETKINEYRRNQEVYQPGAYDSIYSYDYSWTTSYDTIYNGYYKVNKILRPVWCVGDHQHFEMLSYYEVDTDKIPAKYDDKYTDYTIM